MSPLCESFLRREQLEDMEPFYPLHVRICKECFLVQLLEYVRPAEIFTEYAYFSSYSESWVQHAYDYTQAVTERFRLSERSLVVEVASNDGYLLQHFVERGVPVLGIEPAKNVARMAIDRGVPTLTEFFGVDFARRLVSEGRRADLIVANNVLAHVPDVNDFLAGVATLLRDDGTVTFEFPHLLRLLHGLQYDTIYHEHFSYLSFSTVETMLRAHGLAIYDVEELWTHGGSLRVYAQHAAGTHQTKASVSALLRLEEAEGLLTPDRYTQFAENVKESKRALLDLLIRVRREGRQVVGYGAPGKGNTLLNYCGVRTDLLDYTVDRNPYKHGLFTPGTHIPIFAPEKIEETRPDYIVVLPWNLIEEISNQLAFIADWGGRLIVPIPYATVCDAPS